MSGHSTLHGNAFNASAFPTPVLWQKIDIPDSLFTGRCFLFKDDFAAFDGSVATNVGRYSSEAGGFRSFEDTGGSITPLETEEFGVIRFATGATDNNEIWLTNSGAKGVLAKISSTAGKHAKLIFEARVRFNATTLQSIFIGMAEEGLAAADTAADAGTLASKDYIGFRILEADSDGLDTVYRKAGQAEQVVQDVAQAIVADTWYKLGFVFDPGAGAGERIRYYINGVELSGKVTKANIEAATFPSGEELGFLIGGKAHEAVTKTFDLDWVMIGKVRD